MAGGGIYIEASNPQIRNCIITGNTADFGGGMHIATGNPVVEQTAIRARLPVHWAQRHLPVAKLEQLLRQMDDDGVRPDATLLNTLLGGYARPLQYER